MPRRDLPICPTHRLRYDPRLSGGCVLCRRQQRAAAPGPAFGWRSVAVGLVLVASAGLLLWQRAGRTPPPPRAPQVVPVAARTPPARPTPISSFSPTPAPIVPPPSMAAPPTPLPLPPNGACPIAEGPLAEEPRPWPVTRWWHEGASGYARATQEQGRCLAPLLVYFRTDWCPYCHKFEEEVLGDLDVERQLDYGVVKVRINPEDGPDEQAVADRFGATGYPTVFVVVGYNLHRDWPQKRRLQLAELGQADRFLAGIETRRTLGVQNLLHQGERQRVGHDYEGSVASLTEALALEPEQAAAYYERGLTHLAAGSTELAFADLRTALHRGHDPKAIFEAVGRYLGREEQLEEAVACWTVYLERAADDKAQGYVGRSELHWRRGDPQRARDDAEAACRLGDQRGCDLAERLSRSETAPWPIT